MILNVESGGDRLDRYVCDHADGLSRAAVQRLVDDGHILVNGVAHKASYRVEPGDTVTVRVPPPEPAGARPEAIPLTIVYEDDDVIVIDKPAGMVVHPAAGHVGGTLVNAVLGHAPRLDVGGAERPGIVHRLDSDTSGLIVVAKNDAAMHDLQAQFQARRVHKTYLALAAGRVEPPQGVIRAPIGRDPKHRQRMAVVTHGVSREAVTVYHTLANPDGYSLLRVEPQTGRTHQIRVHLAFMGHPIVGDGAYGHKANQLGLDRQFLHAWRLELALPSGRATSFVAPLPDDLRRALAELGIDAERL